MLGEALGDWLGLILGEALGLTEGEADGEALGLSLGLADGDIDGLGEALGVGSPPANVHPVLVPPSTLLTADASIGAPSPVASLLVTVQYVTSNVTPAATTKSRLVMTSCATCGLSRHPYVV